MSDLEIRADWNTAEVRALMRKLQPPRLNQALSVSVNTTAKQVRTFAARIVAKQGGLKRGDVDPSIRIYPHSTPQTLSATVRGSGRPIALIKFAARQTKAGTTANAWGVRKLYKHTFIATMRSGHEGVFVRETKKRNPIKELWGSGVTQVMSQAITMGEIEADAQAKLTTNVVRQLKRYAFRG
ncbi:phage tail protein [Mesorhizobium sp. M0862]|uniref:phage tail protein n=1 Tax=unclassified Mesorhizobium TaxID=325217 RepID=UPI00333687B4